MENRGMEDCGNEQCGDFTRRRIIDCVENAQGERCVKATPPTTPKASSVQSPTTMGVYDRVTPQQLADAGLNPFAVQLLSESIEKNDVTETIKFRYKNLGITIETLKG